MTDENRTEADHIQEAREALLMAALPEVGFDGWSPQTLQAAIATTETDPGLARLAFPRGAIDMILGFHRMADGWLEADVAERGLDTMRIRERITLCVRRRIELVAQHREAVRRGISYMALPTNAPEGAKALWQTTDLIWRLSGDRSTDYNWYSKRAILSGVYSSTVLYWLGDHDPRADATWEFLDRRIDGVMQFEKTKATLEKNPIARVALWGPKQLLGMLKAAGARRENFSPIKDIR